MSKKQHTSQTKTVVNRRARFDYTLDTELIVGVVLTGQEVRAARDGRVHLKGAFVTIRDGELWLNNASFSVKTNERGMSSTQSVVTTPRKLLAHRTQIGQLATGKQQGMSIIPTKLFANGKYIKLAIALGKGKKRHDKREAIKRRDIERDHKKLLRR